MRRDVARTLIELIQRLFRSFAASPRRRSTVDRPKRERGSTARTQDGATPQNRTPGAPLPDTELDDVTIVYAPVRDGDPDPGEVVWTWVAFEDDPSQGKDRPVVIIGRDGDHLAGVQLSSKAHPERDDYIPIGTGPWDPQHRESYAKIERVLAIDPDAVRREGAALDKHRFDELIAALRRHHRVGFR